MVGLLHIAGVGWITLQFIGYTMYKKVK